MAANRRESAKRTIPDNSATQSSPNVGDVPDRSTSYDDPTESDLQEVMDDLMSNDLPFSVSYLSLFEARVDYGCLGPCGVAGLPQSAWRRAFGGRIATIETRRTSNRSGIVRK